jgi:hypothetical protein
MNVHEDEQESPLASKAEYAPTRRRSTYGRKTVPAVGKRWLSSICCSR